VREEQSRLDTTINTLLDNLTESNREFVDKRMNDLRDQRDQLKLRDEELECLELAQSSIDSTVQEAMDFINKLEFTLREGVPQEKLVALRQCVERVCINRRKATINLLIRQIPAGPQGQVIELTIQLGTKCLTETEQQRTRPSIDTPKDG
jgi:predicted  nucleic acid-binding Zn-ribbon protein